MDRTMTSHKKVKILTTLFASEKRTALDSISSNDSDDNFKNKKETNKKKKLKDSNPTFRCDICHFSDSNMIKYRASEVKFLEDGEKTILKFKKNRLISVLCLRHYKSEILAWKGHQNKCCNVLKLHKKPRRTKLVEGGVSVELAENVVRYLDLKIIPLQQICQDCYPKLNVKIQNAKVLDDIPPDLAIPDNVQQDASIDLNKEYCDNDKNNDKIIIFSNIKKHLSSFSKEQKVAIIIFYHHPGPKWRFVIIQVN